jgi:hypothetical protein
MRKGNRLPGVSILAEFPFPQLFLMSAPYLGPERKAYDQRQQGEFELFLHLSNGF